MDTLQLTTSGLTVNFNYFNDSGQVWSVSGTAWESWTDAHYNSGNYNVAAMEQGSSAFYVATPPATVATGAYSFTARSHVDGTIAHDTPIGSGQAVQAVAVSVSGSAAAGSGNPGNGPGFVENFVCYTGCTWSQSITITGLSSAGWTEFAWTLKTDPTLQSDDEALVAVKLTNPAGGSDGLLVNNGRPAASAAGGSLAVSATSPDTTVSWTLSAATMDLPPSPDSGDYYWELTRFKSGGVKEPVGSGRVNLSRSLRRATSAP